MTEDVDVGSEPSEVVEQKQDPIELKALEMGWRPKDEFHGDDEEFIDAKEFVRRKPLFDRIEYQSKELKNVKKALEEFKEHYSKVRETEYQRALDQLKAARKEALTSGDGDRFEAIDDQIKHVEEAAAEVKAVANAQPASAGDPPEFAAWKSQNRWYQKDADMTEFADSLGTGLARKGLPPEEVLRKVEASVRKQFPEKFTNKNKETAPDVESSKGRGSSSGGEAFTLNEQERKVMNDLVRQKVMTKEEYIRDLKKVKGVA